MALITTARTRHELSNRCKEMRCRLPAVGGSAPPARQHENLTSLSKSVPLGSPAGRWDEACWPCGPEPPATRVCRYRVSAGTFVDSVDNGGNTA